MTSEAEHGNRRGLQKRQFATFFDSDAEKTTHEKEATAINSNVSHIPCPGPHTNCCIAEGSSIIVCDGCRSG